MVGEESWTSKTTNRSETGPTTWRRWRGYEDGDEILQWVEEEVGGDREVKSRRMSR